MSKNEFVRSSSAPARTSKHRSYILWITAALCFVAFGNLLSSMYPRTSTSNLDNSQPLNSLSPVALEDYSKNDDRPGPEQRAVVTTLSSESFASSVLVLGHSIRAANTSARRILLYYPDRLTIRTLCHLQSNGWELNPIPHGSITNHERHLKLQSWTLDTLGIKIVIYLDNDALIRSNFDELWSLPFNFAAVPEVSDDERGFLSEFSTSMMLLRTSPTVYGDMLAKISQIERKRPIEFQEFLNEYFAAQVVKLPYIYNANLAIKKRNPALWSALTDHIRIVRHAVANPFFGEERWRATISIWGEETNWWETAWQDAVKELVDRC